MRCLIVVLLTTLSLSRLTAAEPLKIELVAGKASMGLSVEVSGLPAETIARLKKAELNARQWPELFRVVVGGGQPDEIQNRLPVAGNYTFTASGIRFEPQFPLVPGREYRAFLYPDYSPSLATKGAAIEATLTVPKPPPGPRVSITNVYPSGDRLPENTLRFYIQFSGQVAHGNVYRHLKLVREDGLEVKSPFLELDEELWSVDGTRLTIFFHPGRVKRELVPREEEGPILEAGHRYTLSISGSWEDTVGRPLVAGFRKNFTAEPADDHPVDPAAWAMVAPRANSAEPVIVRLPKPLDHALLGRLVWIADPSGNKLPGTWTVGGGERVLTFTPHQKWMKGEHDLVVDTRLEDVCGNRVGEAFEVDTLKPFVGKIESKTFERPFAVR
jgi:hypothetical protein